MRKMILGRERFPTVFTGLSKHLEILSRRRIVDLLRPLMRGEGRKADEGNRKLLSLDSREEDTEG